MRRRAADLPAKASPDDPEPTRFQVVDLPPVLAVVTEYQAYARTCVECGTVTRATLPRDAVAHSVGPRLAATLSYLSGCHGISKRSVEEIASDVFDAPIALGTVANLEREMGAALEAPHQEALEAVRTAAIKHADETSWKLVGKLCWLWAAATASVVAFVIHAKRGASGLTALLGSEIQASCAATAGAPTHRVPAERRQICWAHLKRDFQKIIDRGGPSAWVGRAGAGSSKRSLPRGMRSRTGTCTRAQLEGKAGPGGEPAEPGAAGRRNPGRRTKPWSLSARTCWRWSLRCGRS